jgi:hypothetical protein
MLLISSKIIFKKLLIGLGFIGKLSNYELKGKGHAIWAEDKDGKRC